MIVKHTQLAAAILAAGLASQVGAAPFAECPTQAFLVQGSASTTFGVNLATGSYEDLPEDKIPKTIIEGDGKANAVGYNFHDDHIYGWSYAHNSIFKMGDDFIAQPIPRSSLVNNNLLQTGFYIGDVSVNENAYYIYKGGNAHGLFRIGLDPEADDYLVVSRIISGSTLNYAIFDFAFHPDNGSLYSVDRNGRLIRIDGSVGSSQVLGNVGQSGTFGAVYFDVHGNLYISRNSDGYIFRIAVDDPNPVAEFFAFGPASGNNDGARCAKADILPSSQDELPDFGDAPDSYGTSIENNGARHEKNEGMKLGELGSNDGVQLITGAATGEGSLVQVDAQGGGALNGWVDWDHNGTFDNDEQVITDEPMDDGINRLVIDVPEDATPGDTWGRFRYSSQEGIGPNGGVSDGEVEDYAITVTESGVGVITYPGEGSFVSLAYEDNWPHQGDYDMNDVVVSFQTRKYVDASSNAVRYVMSGKLLAVGASYHSGFAVQLDGVATNNIDEDRVYLKVNGEVTTAEPLEQNAPTDDAVLIISNDLWEEVNADPGCSYFRTEDGCDSEQEFRFELSVSLVNGVPVADAPADVLNPFIFATPGKYHGDGLAVDGQEHPGRSLEIHLKNKPVSAQFNTSFFGLADDNSDPDNNLTFLTGNNMPWALELPIVWAHPKEKQDVMDAYTGFRPFVESLGINNKTWYLFQNSVNDRVIQND